MEIDKDVEAAALDAQRELADVGHHRLAPADVVIAACAHVAGMGVLHYDSDYDLLAKHAGLQFRSEWLTQPACSDVSVGEARATLSLRSRRCGTSTRRSRLLPHLVSRNNTFAT